MIFIFLLMGNQSHKKIKLNSSNSSNLPNSSCSSNSPNLPLPNLIWLDRLVNNKENSEYKKIIEGLNKFELSTFTNTKECIEKLRTLKFVKTYIIISGSISK